MAGDPRLHRLLDEIKELHDRKQADYGREDDPFANVRASEDFGVEPWIGCMIRANDKMRRVQSMALKGQLENESLEDSLMDMAVYSLIAIILYRESQLQTGELESGEDILFAKIAEDVNADATHRAYWEQGQLGTVRLDPETLEMVEGSFVPGARPE